MCVHKIVSNHLVLFLAISFFYEIGEINTLKEKATKILLIKKDDNDLMGLTREY
jgi:hypothetical protein